MAKQKWTQMLDIRLRPLVDHSQDDWSGFVAMVNYAQGALPHEFTGLSPFEVRNAERLPGPAEHGRTQKTAGNEPQQRGQIRRANGPGLDGRSSGHGEGTGKTVQTGKQEEEGAGLWREGHGHVITQEMAM
ncbi:hypothetical protein E4U51_002225 [Claviceps purpurea]|nr:hypothetical protein E4U51_002225 [Claviceps purpurea]